MFTTRKHVHFTGVVMGGPRLAEMLRRSQEEWERTFPDKESLRHQQVKKRTPKILRWLIAE